MKFDCGPYMYKLGQNLKEILEKRTLKIHVYLKTTAETAFYGQLDIIYKHILGLKYI